MISATPRWPSGSRPARSHWRSHGVPGIHRWSGPRSIRPSPSRRGRSGDRQTRRDAVCGRRSCEERHGRDRHGSEPKAQASLIAGISVTMPRIHILTLTERQSSPDFSRHFPAILAARLTQPRRPPKEKHLVSRGFLGGRWRTRTADLCRVKAKLPSGRASSNGSSRSLIGPCLPSSAVVSDSELRSFGDPSDEGLGRVSLHFHSIFSWLRRVGSRRSEGVRGVWHGVHREATERQVPGPLA